MWLIGMLSANKNLRRLILLTEHWIMVWHRAFLMFCITTCAFLKWILLIAPLLFIAWAPLSFICRLILVLLSSCIGVSLTLYSSHLRCCHSLSPTPLPRSSTSFFTQAEFNNPWFIQMSYRSLRHIYFNHMKSSFSLSLLSNIDWSCNKEFLFPLNVRQFHYSCLKNKIKYPFFKLSLSFSTLPPLKNTKIKSFKRTCSILFLAE